MIRNISLGAGVQSSALALMADRELFGPRPDLAIFADTGNEPKAVYSWLEWLSSQLSYPVVIVRSKQRLSDEVRQLKTAKDGHKYWLSLLPWFTIGANGKPGLMQRKCTWNYKIRMILRALRARLPKNAVRRWRRAVKEGQTMEPMAETWIGISTDEAIRMKPSQVDWNPSRWPLIEAGMSRADCAAWILREYGKTAPRSACTFCPFRRDGEWLRLQEEEPEAFREAVELERLAQSLARQCDSTVGIPFLHDSRRPLDTVDFRKREPDSKQGVLPFGNECTGHCGV